jgi:hypothetical protein
MNLKENVANYFKSVLLFVVLHHKDRLVIDQTMPM